MTTDELKAKVEHEKLYDETDMAQIEGDIRSGIPKTFLKNYCKPKDLLFLL